MECGNKEATRTKASCVYYKIEIVKLYEIYNVVTLIAEVGLIQNFCIFLQTLNGKWRNDALLLQIPMGIRGS